MSIRCKQCDGIIEAVRQPIGKYCDICQKKLDEKESERMVELEKNEPKRGDWPAGEQGEEDFWKAYHAYWDEIEYQHSKVIRECISCEYEGPDSEFDLILLEPDAIPKEAYFCIDIGACSNRALELLRIHCECGGEFEHVINCPYAQADGPHPEPMKPLEDDDIPF